MEVVNARTAFLSNYEVLSLLQELDSAALSAGTYVQLPANQRLIMTEARAYLTSKHVDAPLQTAQSVQHLTRGLAKFDLTKAEKLQIVNLMPTTMVVLYTIIEDFEYRFPSDSADGILSLVQESQALASSELATLHPVTSLGHDPGTDGLAELGKGKRKRRAGGEGEGEEQLFLPDEDTQADVVMQELGEVWAEDFDLPEEGDAEIDEVEE
ncbi:hypothetical protein CALVIDRAFT_20626 [Calocera viscosa TUFC12733]|uniref:DNA-directed RNA polymerase III subunit RPC9 n=1 Tax=Calocera viscosa (strain TUFC12733) TaxID=1330018 RepID=A0A167SFW2_CALVF|nr:hypothetical protein CALVIDRAFT_20626 [Calocera viscosa TUFC12733]